MSYKLPDNIAKAFYVERQKFSLSDEDKEAINTALNLLAEVGARLPPVMRSISALSAFLAYDQNKEEAVADLVLKLSSVLSFNEHDVDYLESVIDGGGVN